MTLGFGLSGSGLSASSVMGVGIATSLTGKLWEPSFHLSMAHFGYLQLLSAFLRWPISFWRSPGLLHTVLVLWVRVLITMYFADKWWWLSHCRSWSIWVGFLFTVINNVLSASGLTMVSKKGMAPSSLLSSTVNLTSGSALLICSRTFCLCSSFWMTKVSCIYLSHSLGRWMAVTKAFCSKYYM